MRRYWRFVIPAGVVIIGLGVTLFMLNSNLVFFHTPTEVIEGSIERPDERFRLGGQVLPGTVETTADGVVFDVGDGRTSVTVVHTGAPQQLFQEGIGVVVEGLWTGSEFHSDTMMVKHDEQYRTSDGDEYDEERHTVESGNQ